MTTIKSIIDIVEDFAPTILQEKWDNCGVQLGYQLHRECSGVALSLDVSEVAVDEAINSGANLLITHHPMTISGVRNFTEDLHTSRIIRKAILSGLVIYSAHTSLDSCRGGVNDELCDILRLEECKVLCPSGIDSDTGLGRIAMLPREMEAVELAQYIKNALNLQHLRFCSGGKAIRTVALCSGSGASLIDDAKCCGVDAYISGDLKYHNFETLAAEGLSLFDFGHWESEICTLEIFERIISKKIPTFAPLKIKTNPITCI